MLLVGVVMTHLSDVGHVFTMTTSGYSDTGHSVACLVLASCVIPCVKKT